MVVTILCTILILAYITWGIRWVEEQHAQRAMAWMNYRADADRSMSDAVQAWGRTIRKDITDLYAHQLEADTDRRLHFDEVGERIEDHLDRLQQGAADAADLLHQSLDRQLADLMKEVSDPTILRLMQAIALAFQVDTLDKLTEGAGVMESRTAGSVEGPLAPHPVPNIGRKLEPARFSEETLSTGMQELMEGAAARGITLSLADARQQAMLMLNDVEV